MSHSKLTLGAGTGLFVIAALLAGTMPGSAFADTVSVSIDGESEPVIEEPPEAEPVIEEPPEAEPVIEEPPEAEPVAEEPAEPTMPEEPEDPTPISTCGEGTVLRDGLCVPACGTGLVFESGVCVIDQSTTAGGDAVPVEDRAADAPKSTGSNREFAVGAVAAFVIALVVMTFLGLIAKASKSKDQQP